MCALFGFLDFGHKVPFAVLQKLVQALVNASEVRGNHAAGIAYNQGDHLTIYKRPKPAHKLHFKLPKGTSAVMGHTRFTTQGSEKQNYNNHPFRGNAGTDFALAHNGVLYNDHELRILEDLPQTEIETDSYIAVQLLEKQGTLNFDSLRYVGEHVRGSFTFTILDRDNTLYIIKGESPLYLVHFKELGLYVYTSTPDIMKKAIKQTALRFLSYEVINITDGDLLKISSGGEITRDTFDLLPEYLPRRAWFPSAMRQYDPEDALEELLEMCGYFGVSEDVILYLHEMGCTYDEIEEYLWNPSVLNDELMLEEI